MIQKQPTQCDLRGSVCLGRLVLTQYHLMKIKVIMNKMEILHAAKHS